jgi:CRISPR-associated Cas5-like protein
MNMNMNATNPLHWGVQGEVTIQCEADFALVSRPGNPVSVVTYPFPTPSLCRGLLKAVYHNNYYFPVPTRLEILKPLKTVQIGQTKYRDLALPNGKSSFESGHSPQSILYLQDVAYRIHFEIRAIEAKKFRALQRRLETGGFHSAPYLGTRECMTRLVPVDDTPPCDQFNAIEAHMAVGNRTMLIQAVRGVVDYPPETFEALVEMRNFRMGLEGAAGLLGDDDAAV